MVKKTLLKEAFKRGYMMAIKSLNENDCDPALCKKKLNLDAEEEEFEEDAEEKPNGKKTAFKKFKDIKKKGKGRFAEDSDDFEDECPEKEIAKKFAKKGGNVGCSKFNMNC